MPCNMNSADNLLKRNEYVEALKRMEDGDFFLLENSIKAMFDFNFRAYHLSMEKEIN